MSLLPRTSVVLWQSQALVLSILMTQKIERLKLYTYEDCGADPIQSSTA